MSAMGGSNMPRLCFVLMPFSATASCSEKEWTEVFETVLKPAIEDAGLGYECRRSEATRGNIISAIMRSLQEAYVVVADLTDRNPNVFYELGVRHAMKNRTILLAQNEGNIPSDLRSYAFHIYDWRTEEGKEKLRARLADLFRDVDKEPERADNPVSDFLQRRNLEDLTGARDTSGPDESDGDETTTNVEASVATTGEKWAPTFDAQVISELVRGRDNRAVRSAIQDARGFFRSAWPLRQEEMDGEHPSKKNLDKAEIIPYALPLIGRFEADTAPFESLGQALIQSDWTRDIFFFLPAVGDWLTISEQRRSRFRAIQGAPGICALRFLVILGAAALEYDAYAALKTLMTSRIDSVEPGGGVARLGLTSRAELLHPDALLGYADLACKYLDGVFARNEHVRSMFVDQEDYSEKLAVFLFLWAVGSDIAQPQEKYPLYPGYKLITGAQTALRSFTQRLNEEEAHLAGIASVFGLDSAQFSARWKTIATRLNEAALGGRYFRSDVTVPPDLFGSR